MNFKKNLETDSNEHIDLLLFQQIFFKMYVPALFSRRQA